MGVATLGEGVWLVPFMRVSHDLFLRVLVVVRGVKCWRRQWPRPDRLA